MYHFGLCDHSVFTKRSMYVMVALNTQGLRENLVTNEKCEDASDVYSNV